VNGESFSGTLCLLSRAGPSDSCPGSEEIKNVVEQMAAPGVLVMLQHLKIRTSLVIHENNFAVQNSVKSAFPKRFQ